MASRMKIMQSSFACPRHFETTSTASPANLSPQRWVDLIHFVNERDRQKTGEQDRAGPVPTTEIAGGGVDGSWARTLSTRRAYPSRHSGRVHLARHAKGRPLATRTPKPETKAALCDLVGALTILRANVEDRTGAYRWAPSIGDERPNHGDSNMDAPQKGVADW